MEKKSKILMFPMPALGHLNPILTVTKKLIADYDIIIYTNNSFESYVEKTGCRVVCLYKVLIEEAQKKLQASTKTCETFQATANIVVDGCDELVNKIADLIENEEPDLIIYDNMATFVKWSLRFLKTKYEANNSNKTLPKLIAYHPTFISYKNVFPNHDEENIIMPMNWWDKIKFVFFGLKFYMRTKALSRKFGIDHVNPKDDFVFADTSILNIVFITPEFQARSELCDKNVKFVGACIDDGPHLDNLSKIEDESMKNFLLNFKPKNPVNSLPNEGENVLIYISLGSLFKDNSEFYLKAIDAFKCFDDDIKSRKKHKINLFALINVGDECFKKFSENSIHVPENIKLTPFAPQLEILKRASLFVTHSGMNSTSEAIWFGVPMICVPVSVDQPLVAHRVTNELGLGILLDIHNLTKDDLVRSMHKMFEDETYKKKTFEFSQSSRKYNGTKMSCDIIKSCLEA